MSIIKASIFFDESGKNKDYLSLMGGLLIPDNIYNLDKIQEYNKDLKNRLFSLHWTKYNGDSNQTKLIKAIIAEIMKYYQLLDLNVILYERPKNFIKAQFDAMIYTKFPERIFYGLLRFHGNNTEIQTTIYIENATEYKSKNLSEKIVEQLNIQSTYRGENFKIKKCEYKSKNEEIGIEITDILLGIIRSILENDNSSNTKRARNNLIISLLQDANFYTFMKEIKFFEWKNTNRLEMVEFEYPLRVFLSSQDKWLNHISGV